MSATKYLQDLQAALVPYREPVIQHPVYRQLTGIEDLRRFMEHHVYAVWDFMSLLKALQRHLTCVELPWFPVGDANTRFLINEIVVGEESDVDSRGVRMSHFELYLQAMRQSGADSSAILRFTHTLRAGGFFTEAYASGPVPVAAREFVDFTFRVIGSGKPHVLASVFTFGREDLIPGMFLALVADLGKEHPELISEFQYYLERHIEVDGGHHSELALQMTSLLCGDDPKKWQEATEAAIEGLQHRKRLWDGASTALSLARSS